MSDHKVILVSVTVITYNSSEYILETLDSIKAQTYKNIELIISDDCSKDNTVEICGKWIAENGKRFVNAHFITSDENTGIVGNKFRALEKCKGEWIKGIAGDDIMIESCIFDYISFIKKNDHSFIFSKLQYLYPKSFPENNFKQQNLKESFKRYNSINQYRELLISNFASAPTSFIKRSTLEKIGGYDPRFPMVEDYPLWLKATKLGYRLDFMDKFTVKYRLHDLSLSGNLNQNVKHNKRIVNVRYYKSLRSFLKQILIPEQIKNKLYYHAYLRLLFILKTDLIIFLGNKKNIITSFVSFVFKLLNPSIWKNIIFS